MTRRGGEFARLGTAGIAALGLPTLKARQLAIEAAWRHVAGEALARRVAARRVARGVLELEAEDARWIVAVRTMVPRLAVRLAADYPELGVRRFRLSLAGAGKPPPAEHLPPEGVR